MSASTPLDQMKSMSLFKLDTDCCDEIFEFLSMNELNELSRTCKTMQKVVGEHIQRNYKIVYEIIHEEASWSNEPSEMGNYQYIEVLKAIRNNKPLEHICSHSSKFTSLKELTLLSVDLNDPYVLKVLPNIEILKLIDCELDGDLYQFFLQFCPKLKEIRIDDDDQLIVNEFQNRWLDKSYPFLEKFGLILPDGFEINKLRSFLERNSTIKEFAITGSTLWENKGKILRAKVQLEKFAVNYGYYGFKKNFEQFCKLLCQLYERGFYKRLHLDICDFKKLHMVQLPSLEGLESLKIRTFTKDCDSIRLPKLKKVSLTSHDEMPLQMMSVEDIELNRGSFKDLLAFICNIVNLRKIKILSYNGDLDLIKLNDERQKLHGAKKVTIFIPEKLFLKTKWNTRNGDTDLSHIQLKRDYLFE